MYMQTGILCESQRRVRFGQRVYPKRWFCWCIILPASGSKLPTVLRVLAADAAGCADVEKVGVLSQ